MAKSPSTTFRPSSFLKSRCEWKGGVTCVDHTIVLGRRQAIAGVEHALVGMKVGGYRKVRVSPYLAYRDKGIPDLIPPDAVLICEI